jgi:hypothetical protein
MLAPSVAWLIPSTTAYLACRSMLPGLGERGVEDHVNDADSDLAFVHFGGWVIAVHRWPPLLVGVGVTDLWLVCDSDVFADPLIQVQ